jgi:hypothetical protein
MLCPEDLGWVAIGTTTYTPSAVWSEVDFTLSASFDVNAIMIGSPCDPVGYPLVAGPYIAYIMYDEMSVNESSPELRSMVASGSLCQGNMKMYVEATDALADLQWYHDGISLVTETGNELNVSALGLGNGVYACRIGRDGVYTIARYNLEDPSYTQPAIVLSGDGLLCTSPGFYQWYLNGSPLFGADQSFYQPEVNGTYTVEVTGGEGCSAQSEGFDFVAMGLESAVGSTMRVSHAPGTSIIQVSGADGAFRFMLVDATGRLLANVQGSGAYWQYDVTALPEGVYTALVNDTAVRLVH